MTGASTDLGGLCAPTNRYRGSVLAEMFRSLAALKALQAEVASLVDLTLQALPAPATTQRTRQSAP